MIFNDFNPNFAIGFRIETKKAEIFTHKKVREYFTVFKDFFRSKNEGIFCRIQNPIANFGFNKILIVNLGGIGDLILSSCAFKPLRDKYKNAAIDIVVDERPADLMRSYNIFNSVYTFPFKNKTNQLNLALTLRKNKYDLVINMRTIVSWKSSFKMFLLLKLINGKHWAGRNTEHRGFYFDTKIPETYIAEKKEYEYDIDLMKQLNVDINKINVYIPVTDDADKYVKNLLDKNLITESDFIIGINPGGQLSRRWPAENFIQLIKFILRDPQYKIILTGSAGEKELCGKICSQVNNKNVYNFAGLTTVNQSFLLIKKCKFYISNDTGAMHICVVAETPGIFIFGGGNPRRFGPFKNSDKYEVIYKRVKCSPCEIMDCKNMFCLQQITAAEIYEKFCCLTQTLQ